MMRWKGFLSRDSNNLFLPNVNRQHCLLCPFVASSCDAVKVFFKHRKLVLLIPYTYVDFTYLSPLKTENEEEEKDMRRKRSFGYSITKN